MILLWLGRWDKVEEEKEGFIRTLVKFKDGVEDFYGYQAYFLAAAGINEFKACSLATEIVRQIVKWGFGYFNIEKQEWRTFLDPIEAGATKVIPETIRRLAISELIAIIKNCPEEDSRRQAIKSLGEIGVGNPDAIAGLLQIIRTTEDKNTRLKGAQSLGEIGVGNPDAIAGLLEVIRNTEDEPTRMVAANSLGEIGAGNPDAIMALIKIMETTQDKFTRWRAADILGKIDPENPQSIAVLVRNIETTTRVLYESIRDYNSRMRNFISLGKIGRINPQAIAALVKIIETTESEDTRRLAAEILGENDPKNPNAIAALVNLIATTEDEYTRIKAVDSLEKIGQGNPQAITALVNLIATTEDEETRLCAAKSLEKIDSLNPNALAILNKLIETTNNGYIQIDAAENLLTIDPKNQKVIAALIKVVETSDNEYECSMAAKTLGKIDPGNSQAIAALIRVLENTNNRVFHVYDYIDDADREDLRFWVIYSLEKIGQRNNQAIITALNRILETTDDEVFRRWAVSGLGEIDPGNPNTIAALVKVMATAPNESTRREAAWSLAKIDPGNRIAIAALVKLIETPEDEDTCREAAWSLQKILTTLQQCASVVSALKDNLSDEVKKNNFDLFDECYKVIWNCAENLPYPQFYQAWHYPVQMPHPEVEDNTPVASTPFTQHCNLALLPQIINQAIQSSSRPPNRQVICIDGSRFSDPSNPALQIYTALKKAGCPPITQKPGTINELQAYCEDDLSTAKIALIFYESPTDPPPQGLDLTVLNQLARFSDPPIAVILPQPLTECRLPQFLETEPDLISNILQWLHNLER